MTPVEKILSDVITRLERTEQAQWAKINELEQENMILQDENMHLKDYLAESEENHKKELKELEKKLVKELVRQVDRNLVTLKMLDRFIPVPCITSRPKRREFAHE